MALFKSNFTPESLAIRSLPDRMIFLNRPLLVDFKSTVVRTDTGKLAIEMSSYHFMLKLALSGVRTAYCIGIPRPVVFSPQMVKPTSCFIQPRWMNDKYPFLQWAKEQKKRRRHMVIINNITDGSGDPFYLFHKEKISYMSTALEELLKSNPFNSMPPLKDVFE